MEELRFSTVNRYPSEFSANLPTGPHDTTPADTTAPLVEAPGNILIDANGNPTIVSLIDNPGQLPPTASATDDPNAAPTPFPFEVQGHPEITFTGNSASFPVGTYTVVWKAIDEATPPNIGLANQIVTVQDIEGPQIFLNPDPNNNNQTDPINIVKGAPYNEPGATVKDNYDADFQIFNPTIDGGGPVDTSVANVNFILKYNVSDSEGNPADEVTRLIHIIPEPDTTPPTCTPIQISVITATGNLTPITIPLPNVSEPVTNYSRIPSENQFEVGTYTINWTVTDGAGLTGNCSQDIEIIEQPSGSDTRIPITSCPYDINSPGSYVIKSNLNDNIIDDGNCITVNADNVTIDINGFNLIGPGKTALCDCHGISTSGFKNIKILNGSIVNFGGSAIREDLETAEGIKIENIRTFSNGQYGIFLNGKGHTIIESTIFNNSLGGVHVQKGSNILTNTVYGNEGHGIDAFEGSILTQNIIYNNNLTGITTGSAAKVQGNTCYLNAGSGIVASTGSLVSDNIVYGNNTDNIPAQGGILVSGNVTLQSNQVSQNLDQNILVSGTNNIIQDNIINQSEIGINFGNAENFYSGNKATNNTISYSGSLPSGNLDAGNNVDIPAGP